MDIKNQIKSFSDNVDIKFVFDNNMPGFVKGDKYRISYIIQKLIKNSIFRSLMAHRKKIKVNCQILSAEQVEEYLDFRNVVKLSEADERDEDETIQAHKNEINLSCEIIDYTGLISSSKCKTMLNC